MNIRIDNEIYNKENQSFTLNNFYVNNKFTKLKDANLPLFSFIAKTIREISKKNPDNFVVNKDYLTSDDLLNSFVPNINLRKILKYNISEVIKETHCPDTVINGTKKMGNFIQKIMTEYFD